MGAPPCTALAGARGPPGSPLCRASCCSIGWGVCARAPPAGLVSGLVWGGGDALPQRARPASSAWLSDPARSRVGRGGASCPPRSESAASARGLRASLGNWLRQSIGGRQAFFLGDSPSAAPSREGGPWGPGGLPVAAAETRPTRVGILTQGALVHSSVSGFCRLHLRLQSVAPNAVSLSKAELGPICSPGPAAVQTPQASARSHRMRRGCPDRKSPKDEACVCYGAGAGSWRCWAPPQLRPGTPSGGLLAVLQPCVGSSTHPTNTVRYSLQASQS